MIPNQNKHFYTKIIAIKHLNSSFLIEAHMGSARFHPPLGFWTVFGAVLERFELHGRQLAKAAEWWRGRRGQLSATGRHTVRRLGRGGRRRRILHMDGNLLQSFVQVKLQLCWEEKPPEIWAQIWRDGCVTRSSQMYFKQWNFTYKKLKTNSTVWSDRTTLPVKWNRPLWRSKAQYIPPFWNQEQTFSTLWMSIVRVILLLQTSVKQDDFICIASFSQTCFSNI